MQHSTSTTFVVALYISLLVTVYAPPPPEHDRAPDIANDDTKALFEQDALVMVQRLIRDIQQEKNRDLQLKISVSHYSQSIRFGNSKHTHDIQGYDKEIVKIFGILGSLRDIIHLNSNIGMVAGLYLRGLELTFARTTSIGDKR